MTQRCCFQPGERLANSNVVWMCDSYCGSEHLCGCQTQHICIPLSKTNAVMAVGILVLCVTSENMNNPSTAFMRRDKTTRSFMIVNDIQIEIIMNILMSIKSTHWYTGTHTYTIISSRIPCYFMLLQNLNTTSFFIQPINRYILKSQQSE